MLASSQQDSRGTKASLPRARYVHAAEHRVYLTPPSYGQAYGNTPAYVKPYLMKLGSDRALLISPRVARSIPKLYVGIKGMRGLAN